MRYQGLNRFGCVQGKHPPLCTITLTSRGLFNDMIIGEISCHTSIHLCELGATTALSPPWGYSDLIGKKKESVVCACEH